MKVFPNDLCISNTAIPLLISVFHFVNTLMYACVDCKYVNARPYLNSTTGNAHVNCAFLITYYRLFKSTKDYEMHNIK